MNLSATTESESRRFRRSAIIVAAVVCTVAFVDVPVPFFGSVVRLFALPVLALLVTSRSHFVPAGLGTVALLLPAYFLLPVIVNGSTNASDAVAGLVDQFIFIGVALLLARQLGDPERRLITTRTFVLFASVSGAVAMAQSAGLLPPLGRDLWGRAVSAAGSFRGAAFLADPNFLAVLLAATVPLGLSLRFVATRVISLVAIFGGIYATNSRAGMILGLLAVILVLVVRARRDSAGASARTTALWLVALLALALILNIGEQRDRIVDGLQIGLLNAQGTNASADPGADLSAADRRAFADAWLQLGIERFPFGAGVNAQDYIVVSTGLHNAAHNNFLQLLGQGGFSGLVIGAVTLISAVTLFRSRRSAFALSGLIVICGGFFLSYPGTLFLVLPVALADSQRAHGIDRLAIRKMSAKPLPAPRQSPRRTGSPYV